MQYFQGSTDFEYRLVIGGNKKGIELECKMANKQKSTLDKVNKNKGLSRVQQLPRIEEITKMSKNRFISKFYCSTNPVNIRN